MKFRMIMFILLCATVISGCTNKGKSDSEATSIHPIQQTRLYTLDDVMKALQEAGLKFNEKPLPNLMKTDSDLFLNHEIPAARLDLDELPIWVYIFSSEKETAKAVHEFDERIKGRGMWQGITRQDVASANNVLVIMTSYPIGIHKPSEEASKVQKAIENLKSK
jgi:hypothetical protein